MQQQQPDFIMQRNQDWLNIGFNSYNYGVIVILELP